MSLLLRNESTLNLSAIAFGSSLATAIYGLWLPSVLLLLLSGILTTKESIRLLFPDLFFILSLTFIYAIVALSSVIRVAYHELTPISVTFIVSIYIFFIIKTNFEHLNQTVYLILLSHILSSVELISIFILTDKNTGVEILSDSYTAILIVPNDYVFFAIVMPLISYSLRLYESISIKWIILLLHILGIVTAFVLNSRLCFLLFSLSLIFEFRLYKNWFNLKTIIFVCFLTLGFIHLFPDFLIKLKSLPSSRIPLWDASLHQLSLQPLLGNGLDSFRSFYSDYIIDKTYPNWITIDNRIMPWPHNFFLEMLSSFGVFASFVVFYGLYFCCTNLDTDTDSIDSAISASTCLFVLAACLELTYLRVYPILMVVFFTAVHVSGVSRSQRACIT